jgi:hypothetical protein
MCSVNGRVQQEKLISSITDTKAAKRRISGLLPRINQSPTSPNISAMISNIKMPSLRKNELRASPCGIDEENGVSLAHLPLSCFQLPQLLYAAVTA